MKWPCTRRRNEFEEPFVAAPLSCLNSHKHKFPDYMRSRRASRSLMTLDLRSAARASWQRRGVSRPPLYLFWWCLGWCPRACINFSPFCVCPAGSCVPWVGVSIWSSSSAAQPWPTRRRPRNARSPTAAASASSRMCCTSTTSSFW